MSEPTPEELTAEPTPEGGFEKLMRTRDVAQLCGVNPRTVTLWAKQGRLRCLRTAGGHRRYPEDAVRAVLEGRTQDARRRPEDLEDIYVIIPEKAIRVSK